MRRRYPLAAGVALALGAAAPAGAATVTVRGLDTPAWDNPFPVVKVGDTVVWTFAGTNDYHNVAAKNPSPSWAVFTPVAKPSVDGTWTFDAPGSYEFVCQVHAAMTGTVTVADAAGTLPPPPPPPPLSEQPFPNDGVAPAALETGGLDRTAPQLRSLRVLRRAHGTRISFHLSERSTVTVRLERGRKVVRTRHVSGSGRMRLTVRDRSLRPGRYGIELRAEDIAGNRSAVRRARVTVRRT